MIDRWIFSQDKELLEREGATPMGIKIIDELNEVYRITGVLKKITRTITSDIKHIHAVTNRPVKILEIGMRDGALLNIISEFGVANNTPLVLHGVEFRENLVKLAKKRLALNSISFHSYCISNKNFGIFPDDYFDIVYSAFVLHHQTLPELKELISESFRISKFSVFHLDLSRSLKAIILIWTFYTFFGFLTSRKDAVLSCRRSYRKNEVNQILLGINQYKDVVLKKLPPMYLSLQKPIKKRNRL